MNSEFVEKWKVKNKFCGRVILRFTGCSFVSNEDKLCTHPVSVEFKFRNFVIHNILH